MHLLQKKIDGIILPSKWDNDGKIIDIKIMAFDEAQYEVENTRKGRMLIEYLRQTVTVLGDVMVMDKKKYIRVAKFKIHDRPFTR